MKTTYTIHPDGGRSVTQYGVPELIPRRTEARSAAHARARYCVDLVRLSVSFTILLLVLAACAAVLLWAASLAFPALLGLSWKLVAGCVLIALGLWVMADK